MESNSQSKHRFVVEVPEWSKYILLVKVGSECRPAGDDEIKEVKDALDSAFSDPAKPSTVGIVTHHAVKVELLQVRL